MNDREKYLALEKEFRLACIEIKQLKEDKLDRIESILSAELNLISRKYEILRDWYVNTWEDYDGLFNQEDIVKQIEKNINAEVTKQITRDL